MSLSNFCARGLRLIGVHPDYPLCKLIVIINSTVMLSCFILGLTNLYLERDAETAESLGIILIVYTNYLMHIFGRKVTKRLLIATKSFRQINHEDEEILYFLQHLKRVRVFFIYLMYPGVLSFMIKPFILNETSIFKLYKPPQVPFYLFYIFECYAIMFIGVCYVSSDIFICSLIVWAAVQFRSLNLSIKGLKFLNRDIDCCRNDLKHIIKYHQFLIRYVEDLNRLFSTLFAFLIIYGVALMCMEMYVLSENNESVIVLINCFVLSSSLITQYFSVYDLPAQFLLDQSYATADMIYYELDWYLPHVVPLRKYLVFMIMRSQKAVCIRAGGYHTVNNESILIMLKTAYSFFTFLQTLS